MDIYPPPALPCDSIIYSHAISGGSSGNNENEEDMSGLVPMLVDETGVQHIGGKVDVLILAPCDGYGQGVIGA